MTEVIIPCQSENIQIVESPSSSITSQEDIESYITSDNELSQDFTPDKGSELVTFLISVLKASLSNKNDYVALSEKTQKATSLIKLYCCENLELTLVHDDDILLVMNLIKAIQDTIFPILEPTKSQTMTKLKINLIIDAELMLSQLIILIDSRHLFGEALVFLISTLLKYVGVTSNKYSLKIRQYSIYALLEIFIRYEEYRISLIDDIFNLFVLKVSTKQAVEKITMRSKHIQILTYITLLFLQSITPLSDKGNLSDNLIIYIIEKLNKIVEEEKVEDSGYSNNNGGFDYRNMLFVFYSDLLEVISDPMWPLAERMLIIYLHIMSSMIKEDKYINAIHLKILARICDSMQILKDKIDGLEVFPNNNDNDEVIDTIYSCCNENIIHFNIKSDIKCIDCKRIFHRKCIYLSESMDNWKCKRCNCYNTAMKEIETVKNLIKNEKFKKRAIKKVKYSNTFINRQILLHYCAWQYNHYNSIEYKIARNYYLYQYSQEENCKDFSFYDFMKNISTLPQFFITDILNENDIIFYILQLMRDSIWLKCKTLIVMILNKSLSSQYPKIRSEAIKGIRTIIENNENRVGHDILTKLIVSCLKDPKSSVRDASVMLIGEYIFSSEEYIELYFPHIIDLLIDPGYSVKKHSLELVRQLIYRNPDSDFQLSIFIQFMNIIKDPFQDIKFKNLVYNFIKMIWFDSCSPYSLPSDWNYTVKSNKNVIITSPNSKTYKSIKECIEKNEKMNSLFLESHTNRIISIFSQLFKYNSINSTLLKSIKYILSEESGLYPSSSELADSLSIVQCVIRIIINKLDKYTSTKNNEIISLFFILGIFADISTELFIQYIGILSIYITTSIEDLGFDKNNKNEVELYNNIYKYTLLLFDKVFQHQPLVIPHDIIIPIGKSLYITIMSNKSPEIVRLSCRCLSLLLCNCDNDVTLVITLLDVCKKVLKDKTSGEMKMLRALSIIGDMGGSITFTVKNMSSLEPLLLECAKICQEFYMNKSSSDNIQLKSITSLCLLFAVIPQVFTEDITKEIIIKSLKHSNPTIPIAVLYSLNTLLKNESKRANSLSYITQSNQSEIQIRIKNCHKAINIFTVVFGSLLNSIIDVLFYKNKDVRYLAADMLISFDKSGILPSIRIIPYIIMCLFDLEYTSIHEICNTRLYNIKEISGNTWECSYSLILQKAYEYQMKVFDRYEVNYNKSCLFDYFYEYCIHPKLSSRNQFLKTAINETTVAINKSDLKYLSFLCNLLYSIKYLVEEEPICIISLIDSEVSLNSTNSYYQLSQIFTEENEEDEPLDNVISFAVESCKFISLLLLRSSLKSDYKLQPKNIADFDIYNQAKSRETAISKDHKRGENYIKEFVLPTTLDDCQSIYMEYDGLMENYGGDGDENQSKKAKRRKTSTMPVIKAKKVKKSTIKAYEKDSDYSEC